jgi:hypothetical protein
MLPATSSVWGNLYLRMIQLLYLWVQRTYAMIATALMGPSPEEIP